MIHAIFLKITKIPGKSTCPLSMIRSMARPDKIGRYKVKVTVTAAIMTDAAR
jgi:hypothetical protein